MRLLALMAFAVANCLGSAPVGSHHSYVSKYDARKKIVVSGVITSVSYANPHVFFHVQPANGTEWRVETESIPILRAKGLTSARLASGAQVRVTGWPARSGAAELGLHSIRIGRRQITIRRRPR